MRRIVHTSAGPVHLEFTEHGQVEIALYDEATAGSRAETWPEADLAEGLERVALIPLAEAMELADQIRGGVDPGSGSPHQWPLRLRVLQTLPLAVVVAALFFLPVLAAWVLFVWLF